MPLQIAIIGAGPAGFYSASEAIKAIPDCRIDLIDRLPTPYGLVRAGVAPDHQTSKKVSKIFERTAAAPNVRFLGNVQVGEQVSIEELKRLYDAVVLCTGAQADRRLGIPGEDKVGVYGSASFVGWYNANPLERTLNPHLETKSVAVIGAGNVALDVARLLAKTAQEISTTDMALHAQRKFAGSGIREIRVFARRGPLEASFTHRELEELGELAIAVPLVDSSVLPPEDAVPKDAARGSVRKNMELLRAYSQNKGDEKPVRIHLEFYARPVEVLGGTYVQALRLERTRPAEGGAVTGTGELFEFPCNVVVTCIGTRGTPLAGVPFDERSGRFVNVEGKIDEGLYCAGWAKRGPSGTIATNHPDGVTVASQLMRLSPDALKLGSSGLDALLRERAVRTVSFEEWRRLDALEVTAAAPGAPRQKFVSVEEMLQALDKETR